MAAQTPNAEGRASGFETCAIHTMSSITMALPTTNFSSEIARIEQTYARRGSQVPSQRYSPFNPGTLFMNQEVERHLLAGLRDRGYSDLQGTRILDVGCGTGFWLRNFVSWGARPENLFGLDLLPERVERARRSLPALVTVAQGSATEVAFSGSSFDLVLQFTVFSSILQPEMKQQVAREMLRVLKPSGYAVWYDFYLNNPSNKDVRGVSKKEIRTLFPDCLYSFHRITLAAPLSRALGRWLPFLYHTLATTKVLSTHYLAFIQKPEA
jgi:ubiquinone/menaquinone biosynthesis C-methylase UbiE